MAMQSVNPATGETLGTYPEHDAREVERRLSRAAAAARAWRRVSYEERAGCLTSAAELLEREKDAYGRMMTLEMGKPIAAAREEAAKCALACRFYAEHGASFLATERAGGDGSAREVRYQPLGVVLAVMPWNFPFWQVVRFAAPAIMAGNVGLLKHASNVPRCALALEELFARAGAPEGVFQTLLVDSSTVAGLIADPRIAAVTLTGSERAGSDVGSRAGAAIKKSVLELGGSDPFIVMPSAEFEQAVSTAVRARVINNGQSCIAAKRFIVAEAIADRFESEMARRMAALRVGDPIDEATEIGPLATSAILDDLESQVQRSVEMGARVVTGGKRLVRPGNYFAPTVLADAPEGSPAAGEELFGPVATIFRARDQDEAIAIANGTTFGLGASAWTTDPAERERFVDELEAGLVFINGMVASDPRLPFGGVKRSGYGRELGEHGIREFVNVKTVVLSSPAGDRRASTE